MRYYFLALATLIAFVITGSAHAQRSDSIAAVVNGDIITYTDLYDRIDLMMKSAGMPNTEEFKKRLLPQVLSGLITEQIQIQEATRLGLTVNDNEIQEGFAKLAAQNKLEAEQFESILKRQNVSMETLDKQIRAQLAWTKVIQQQIRPRVTLTQDDINAEIERLKAKEGQEEYFVAEIFLPIEGSADQASLGKGAMDLSRQLSADVKNFPAAARQFSQSATAAAGGAIGWVTPDQMADQLGDKITSMTPGTVSEPIRTPDGYTILFVREKRIIDLGNASNEEKLRIKMAMFELPDDDTKRKEITDEANSFRMDLKGCLDIMEKASTRKNVSMQEIDNVRSAIPQVLLDAVEGTNIGEAGKIVNQDSGVVVPMLCGREGGTTTSAIEREVENRMGTQRMDVLQKRYLRDLITDAYIERRV